MSSQSSVVVLLFSCLLFVACQSSEPTAPPTPTLTAELAQGKRLFSQHCGSCHAIEADTVIVGPSLFAVADRAKERAPDMTPQQYVELSILQPEAILVPGYDNVMPTNFGTRLTGEELDAIVAYVMSLH
ncbi:MAG: c-type cytochrome [Chloroflexota bacterium]